MKNDQKKTDRGTTPGIKDGTETVVLGEDLEIADAGILLEQLRAVVKSNSNILIDGSQIRAIDTAILQLLAVLFCQALKRKIGISWQQPSDTLRKSAALLGLETHLCLEADGA